MADKTKQPNTPDQPLVPPNSLLGIMPHVGTAIVDNALLEGAKRKHDAQQAQLRPSDRTPFKPRDDMTPSQALGGMFQALGSVLFNGMFSTPKVLQPVAEAQAKDSGIVENWTPKPSVPAKQPQEFLATIPQSSPKHAEPAKKTQVFDATLPSASPKLSNKFDSTTPDQPAVNKPAEPTVKTPAAVEKEAPAAPQASKSTLLPLVEARLPGEAAAKDGDGKPLRQYVQVIRTEEELNKFFDKQKNNLSQDQIDTIRELQKPGAEVLGADQYKHVIVFAMEGPEGGNLKPVRAISGDTVTSSLGRTFGDHANPRFEGIEKIDLGPKTDPMRVQFSMSESAAFDHSGQIESKTAKKVFETITGDKHVSLGVAPASQKLASNEAKFPGSGENFTPPASIPGGRGGPQQIG